MPKSISGYLYFAGLVGRQLPKLTWLNVVPEWGKTTHIVGNFNENVEIVITMTVEVANDLIKRETSPPLG